MVNHQLRQWPYNEDERIATEESDLHDVGEYTPLAERRRMEREE